MSSGIAFLSTVKLLRRGEVGSVSELSGSVRSSAQGRSGKPFALKHASAEMRVDKEVVLTADLNRAHYSNTVVVSPVPWASGLCVVALPVRTRLRWKKKVGSALRTSHASVLREIQEAPYGDISCKHPTDTSCFRALRRCPAGVQISQTSIKA